MRNTGVNVIGEKDSKNKETEKRQKQQFKAVRVKPQGGRDEMFYHILSMISREKQESMGVSIAGDAALIFNT